MMALEFMDVQIFFSKHDRKSFQLMLRWGRWRWGTDPVKRKFGESVLCTMWLLPVDQQLNSRKLGFQMSSRSRHATIQTNEIFYRLRLFIRSEVWRWQGMANDNKKYHLFFTSSPIHTHPYLSIPIHRWSLILSTLDHKSPQTFPAQHKGLACDVAMFTKTMEKSKQSRRPRDRGRGCS